jgi:hypothetical protein
MDSPKPPHSAKSVRERFNAVKSRLLRTQSPHHPKFNERDG